MHSPQIGNRDFINSIFQSLKCHLACPYFQLCFAWFHFFNNLTSKRQLNFQRHDLHFSWNIPQPKASFVNIKYNFTVKLFENHIKRHPDFITDLILIGVFSAFSQIFIAFTIKNFGAVVFVIIMTTRSIPQVIFSWLVYHHYFGIFGWIGIVITFLTIGRLFFWWT